MKFFTLLFLLFGATALQSQSFFVDLDADTTQSSPWDAEFLSGGWSPPPKTLKAFDPANTQIKKSIISVPPIATMSFILNPDVRLDILPSMAVVTCYKGVCDTMPPGLDPAKTIAEGLYRLFKIPIPEETKDGKIDPPSPLRLSRPVERGDLTYWYYSHKEELHVNELELAAGITPTKMFIGEKQVNRMFTHPIRAWDHCEGCVFVTAVPYWVHPVVK